MWGLPPPFSGTGLADGRREQRLCDTIERTLVNIEGGVRVGKQQLEGGEILSIKRHSDSFFSHLGAVLGLTGCTWESLAGARATTGALDGEEVCGLIVVDVFHGAAFSVTVTVIDYRHCDTK